MKDINDCFVSNDTKGLFEILKSYSPDNSIEKTEHGTLVKKVKTTSDAEINIYHAKDYRFYFENQKSGKSVEVDVNENSDLIKLNQFLKPESEKDSSVKEDGQYDSELAYWEKCHDPLRTIKYPELDEDDMFFGGGIRPGSYD